MKAFILGLLISSSSLFAQTSLIPSQKEFTLDQDKTAKEEPCLDSAEELMRKLEEEKKKKEAAGKALNLQGGNDAGCSID